VPLTSRRAAQPWTGSASIITPRVKGKNGAYPPIWPETPFFGPLTGLWVSVPTERGARAFPPLEIKRRAFGGGFSVKVPHEKSLAKPFQRNSPFPSGLCPSGRSAPVGLYWPPSLRSKPFRFLGKGDRWILLGVAFHLSFGLVRSRRDAKAPAAPRRAGRARF
jgi:hypothetical protein